MQLHHVVLATLLATSYASPAALPRQLAHPERPTFDKLAARQTQDQTSSDLGASAASNDTTSSTTTSSSSSATTTGPRNHNVAVGQNGTTFTPSTLKNIPPGDTLTFYFYPSNYSIVQSSFEKPCEPLGGGIFSGFNPTFDQTSISRQKFVVNVTSAETVWIYAIDGQLLANDVQNVCEKGMVMVMNPLPKADAAGRTLASYRKAASVPDADGSQEVTCPTVVSGGDVKGVSDKEMARWMGKHPIGGAANGTVSASTVNASSVANYESAAAEGRLGRGNSLMAFGVLLMTSVFGLGL